MEKMNAEIKNYHNANNSYEIKIKENMSYIALVKMNEGFRLTKDLPAERLDLHYTKEVEPLSRAILKDNTSYQSNELEKLPWFRV
ncbi:uncharacterized protein KGF55_004531 [Candida pseudojiufengensis]|uniref:uncharacterized protein n=1 Tax=Candida pseudojiufengensis TaxID=497109 RepID=UPI002224430B|nr:uncharacterized protein KGF55_004531 [Candida pseudojiufengensis]KAI5960638.1 hypothetical protein KGF55_004531 [Candida pseudojiufengensis]